MLTGFQTSTGELERAHKVEYQSHFEPKGNINPLICGIKSTNNKFRITNYDELLLLASRDV